MCTEKGNKYNTSFFLLPLKRDRKNVWHLQPVSSVWRPLAFLSVTLSKALHSQSHQLGVFYRGFTEMFVIQSPAGVITHKEIVHHVSLIYGEDSLNNLYESSWTVKYDYFIISRNINFVNHIKTLRKNYQFIILFCLLHKIIIILCQLLNSSRNLW